MDGGLEWPDWASCHDRRFAALPLIARAGALSAAEPDLSALSDMTTGAVPIGATERQRRIARAQSLMAANGIGAVVVESAAA